MTNAEKIRNMDTKELAKLLEEISNCCHIYDCEICYLDECEKMYGRTASGIKRWLESEAEE